MTDTLHTMNTMQIQLQLQLIKNKHTILYIPHYINLAVEPTSLYVAVELVVSLFHIVTCRGVRDL
jgi:hypothetical protein